jgi:dTDP-4-amino-4,6-dideoxygalactose transaminase
MLKTVKFNDLSAQWEAIEKTAMPKIEAFLKGGFYIGGEHVESFEKKFAAYTGSEFAIGTSNGSDGLKLAVEALNLYGRVNVILPANGFMADVFAVKYQINAKYDITFIDNDVYYQIDPKLIREHLEKKRHEYDFVIILPVHLYGHPADMQVISNLAKEFKCHIIEDASQAQGASCYGKMVGSWGDITVYSLYPGKNLGACGDAGIITTNSEYYKERLMMLRNYGSPKKYHHDIDGWNHRLDPIQAIILEEKLQYLEKWNSLRWIHHTKYIENLAGIEFIHLPKRADYVKFNAHHVFPILAAKRDGLMDHLEENGITTIIHYPIALEKCKCNENMKIEYVNTNAIEYARHLLSLPMHPFLKEEEITYVCDTVRSYYPS